LGQEGKGIYIPWDEGLREDLYGSYWRLVEVKENFMSVRRNLAAIRIAHRIC
jgi:hypothetical protein